VSPRLYATAPLLAAASLCVALFACPSSTSNNTASCPNLCTTQLPCAETLNQCLAACCAQERTCNASGHPATFQAYVTCAVSAGFSCTDAGQPVVNAPCGPQATDLLECQIEIDGGLNVPDAETVNDTNCVGTSDIPDAELVKDTYCVNATGGCFNCCAKNHPTGAAAFSAAAIACTCSADGGVCGRGGACATEACASPPKMPVPDDPCDQCLTNALNDQTADAGACVAPVTLQCNKTLDCALYVNCAMQAGCTN
jgi:hypothetical protein